MNLIANIILAGSTQPREDIKLQEIFNVNVKRGKLTNKYE